MKVSKRKIWGLLGLFIVAAVTAFAALMPHPGASAVSANDTVTVRVTGEHPLVKFTSPTSGTKYNKDNHIANISLNYENLDSVVVELKYTDPEGKVSPTEQIQGSELSNLGGVASTWNHAIDLSQTQWGYGHYELHARGTRGEATNITEDTIDFYYHTDSLTDTDDKGNPWIEEPVIPSGGEGESSDVQCVEIHVWDDNGNEIEGLKTTVCKPFNDFTLPFDEVQPPLSDGHYNIEVKSFNKDGDLLSDEWYDFDYRRNTDPHVTTDDKGNPEVRPDTDRGDAKCLKVTVRDSLGNAIPELYYQDCTPPFEDYTLPFDKYPWIPDGKYTITESYTDEDGNEVDHHEYEFYYERKNQPDPGITGKDDNGNPNVHPGGRENAQCMVVQVKDAKGNIIPELTYEDCTPPFEDFTLPFDQVQPPLPDGKYQIEVHYFEDKDKTKEIQPPDVFGFDYERTKPGISGEDQNGNPKVHPGDWENAQCIKVHVRDHVTGEIIPGVEYQDCEPPFEDFVLPFDEHNVPDGKYDIVVEFFEDKDMHEKLGERTFLFDYVNKGRKNILNVPNTGGLFGGLNLSRSDYLITGLVVLVIAAGGAAFIIYRKKYSRKNSSRRRH